MPRIARGFVKGEPAAPILPSITSCAMMVEPPCGWR